jgi:hypothetical protein
MDPLATASPPGGDETNRDEVDRAMASEDAAREARKAERRAAAGRLTDLPRLLRGIGATVLVAAAFTFMLQTWELGDDVARYYHFLAFTVTLAGAGFFCGLRLRDERSARTFLGLAAGAVPVHFTVLGALLYSQFPWLSGFTDYPGYAHFSAPDQIAALVTAAVGFAFLVPVCWTAFLTFARPEARILTLGYLAANATLLVPTRHPDVIGGLALALLLGTLAFDRRVLAPAPALRTPGGRLVRLLMAVPFAILVGRTFNLYEPSSLFLAAVLASVSVVLFAVAPFAVAGRRQALLAQHASLVPMAAAWWCSLVAVDELTSLPDAWALPLLCLPMAALYGALSLRSLDGGAGLRKLAALVATGGMTLQLVLFPGVGSSLACLATAIVATAYGYAAEQRGVLGLGVLALIFGLLYHLRYAAELYALSPWGSLALLGIVTVIAGSLVERHHRSLSARVVDLRGRLQGRSA